MRPAPLLLSLLLLLPLTAATHASAQQIVSASADVSIDLGAGVVAADEDVVVDDQLGILLLEDLGPLPTSSEVVALELDVNGDRLLAFDTTTELMGGVVARKGDVVRFDGATYSIEFDASLAGVPSSASTDAASLSANGLLLSFDTTVSLPGSLVAADEDLVEWDGAAFSLRLDGSSEGVDSSLDIDAAQDLGAGQFLVSFDTTGSIGGLVFADEDVLRFDGASWSLEIDSSALDSAWATADLDAVMVPEPGVGLGLVAGGVGLITARRRRRGSLRLERTNSGASRNAMHGRMPNPTPD